MRPRTAGSRSWTTPASRSARTSTIAPSNTSPDPAGQQRRLDQVDAAALVLARVLVAGRHQPRQLLEGVARPRRHRCPGAQGHADLADEPVDQPAQRRGRVRVRSGDRGVHRVAGDLAVERDVRGAAQQARRLGQQGRVRGVRRVEVAGSRHPASRRPASRRRARAPTASAARRPAGPPPGACAGRRCGRRS